MHFAFSDASDLYLFFFLSHFTNHIMSLHRRCPLIHMHDIFYWCSTQLVVAFFYMNMSTIAHHTSTDVVRNFMCNTPHFVVFFLFIIDFTYSGWSFLLKSILALLISARSPPLYLRSCAIDAQLSCFCFLPLLLSIHASHVGFGASFACSAASVHRRCSFILVQQMPSCYAFFFFRLIVVISTCESRRVWCLLCMLSSVHIFLGIQMIPTCRAFVLYHSCHLRVLLGLSWFLSPTTRYRPFTDVVRYFAFNTS